MKINYYPVCLFISVCLIWGTTWMAMQLAVATVPPVLATSIRFAIATPILYILCRLCKQPLLFPSNQKKWMFIIALCYFAIPFTLLIFGEIYISSGLASIIFANIPIFIMILSSFLLGLRLTTIQITGLFAAVLSLCAILFKELHVNGSHYFIGIAAIGLAAIMHASMYVLVQKHCHNIKVLTYNTMPSLIAALFLFVFSSLTEHPIYAHFSLTSILSIVYLGIIASVGGILAYFMLNRSVKPFTASMAFLCFPLVALAISAIISGHTLSLFSWFAMIPLLLGMLVVGYKKKSKPIVISPNETHEVISENNT